MNKVYAYIQIYNNTRFLEISESRGGEYKDDSLLGYSAV
jgi:hypothetical protein